MPNSILSGEYVSTDGEFKFDLGSVAESTILNAVRRTFDHVFGNEAIAKASTAKRNANGGEVDVASVVLEARTKYLESMVAGTWGEKGVRAPRQPGANRFDQIYNMLLADDARKAIVKLGFKAGDEKNTWVAPNGAVFDLEAAMTAYTENPKLGEARVADLRERAQRRLDNELAEAKARQAAREREAGVEKVQGEGLVL